MKLKQIRVDGYKNLIDCVVNLGDFNILVGPNNSGKSNFLESIQMLYWFCFGDEKMREMAFRGFPMRKYGTSISHLKKYEEKSLGIGVTFEVEIKSDIWTVDYDFTVQIGFRREGRFLKESLRAKPCLRTGVATNYISRTDENLVVESRTGKKEHRIPKDIPAFTAIKTIYPDFTDLPNELKNFVYDVSAITMTDIFLFSPDNLRESMWKKETFEFSRKSSFNLLTSIDEIHHDKEKYESFRQNVCDILNVEDFKFVVGEIAVPPKDADKKSATERILRCFLKRQGDDYSHLGEYSDGTLVVVAVLAAFFSMQSIGPIICVEEIENCLHPSALKKLLHFLKDHSSEKPVLITTHSPYVLNCVNPEDVNVAIVDETGATHFEKVRNTKQLRDYLKSGFMSFGDMLPSNFADVLGK